MNSLGLIYSSGLCYLWR